MSRIRTNKICTKCHKGLRRHQCVNRDGVLIHGGYCGGFVKVEEVPRMRNS